jgi:hypothetical protein
MNRVSSDYSISNAPLPEEPKVGEEVKISDLEQATSSLTESYTEEDYREMYNIFYPGQEDQFEEFFIEYMKAISTQNLSPDELYTTWMNLCFHKSLNLDLNKIFSVKEDASRMINIVYMTMIDTVDLLQFLTVVQAEYLEFYSALEKSYTDMMEKIPTYSPGDDSPLGSTPVLTADDYSFKIDKPLPLPPPYDQSLYPCYNEAEQILNAASARGYLTQEEIDRLNDPYFDLVLNERPKQYTDSDYAEYRNDANAWAAEAIENLRSKRDGVINEAKVFQTALTLSIEEPKKLINNLSNIMEMVNNFHVFRR